MPYGFIEKNGEIGINTVDKEEFFDLSFSKIIRIEFVRLSPIIAKLHPWSTDTTRKTFSKRIFLKRKKKKEEQRQLGSWLSPWLDGDPSTNRAAHKSFPPFIKRSGIRNENIKRVRHAVSRSVVPPPPRSKNNLKVHAREYPSGGDPGDGEHRVGPWRGGLTRRGY